MVDLIAMILGMPRALFPQMAHESFGGPLQGGTVVALLSAAMSAGAVAGGVFSGWLPRIRRQGSAVIVAILVWGVTVAGFGLASDAAHGCAGLLLWAALGFLAVGGGADMGRPLSGRRSCSRPHPTTFGVGCRACLSWL